MVKQAIIINTRMSLTSKQKHYLKKNLGFLDIETLARNLNLGEKEILKFAKKHLPQDKFKKIAKLETSNNSSHDFSSFHFGTFALENLPIFILLTFLVVIVYYNTLGNGFVSDDIQPILKNPDIGNLKYVFNFGSGMIQRIIHFIAFKMGGLTPGYFRIFNIILHLGSTILVFTILNLLTKKNIAIFASIIFAVHPILTESITWISGMSYALYSFFLLFSFFLYIISKNNRKYYFFSLALFIMALISSEKAVVFFLILGLYELCFGNIKENWKRFSPYFILNLILVITYAGQIGSRISSVESSQYQSTSGMENPLVQIPIAITTYLKLMFWPDRLTLYQTELNFSPFIYTLCLISFLLFLSLVFYSWKKNKNVFFWLSFFVISLLPTLTPFKISWVVAERYVYLGSIGVFVLFAMGFEWLMQKFDVKYKVIFYSLFAIIILVLSIRTIYRNMDWKNEDTLWIATAKTSPSGQNVHNNLGDVYARNKNYPKAIEEFTKATQINPNYADAYHNLANTYQAIGQTDKAIENYQKALSINPNIWQSWQNLASIYYEAGNLEKADEAIKKAIAINPENQDLKNNLVTVEAGMKNESN